jgi:hypothetical protein
MTDKPKAALLERIQENVRGEPPLWYWLLFLTVSYLPWPIGAGLVELLKQTSVPVQGKGYLLIVFIQCVISSVIILLMVWHSKRRFYDEPDQQSNPSGAKLGVFQLGFGFFREIHRSWWNAVLFIAALFVLKIFVNFGNVAEGNFWDAMVAISVIFAVLYSGLGLLCVVGLLVRRKLRDESV